ncbi:MAG: glycosyltransferase family 4 protein [Tissierellia bacterium]|nr:glycosyltransferase family 4 protein [Tissierellia bacterium]
MKVIHIITSSFYDYTEKKIKIGGVETYIYELSKLLLNRHYEVFVYEKHIVEFVENYDNIIIKSFKPDRSYQELFNSIYNKTDLFIIGTDQLPLKARKINVIAIQHGIAFDIPKEFITSFWGKYSFLTHTNKLIRSLKNIYRFHNFSNFVCVDYNYYNWLKTMTWIKTHKKLKVIPNFTSILFSEEDIISKLTKNEERKSLIFARRFVDYRGTILFKNVAEKLLKGSSNIEITFAGNGPLEGLLRNTFKDNHRVKITSFDFRDSIAFHYKYDICVVPSMYSEGTSLSLCEGMAAGCFPICSYVGGMSNMIIDGFNGKIVYPNENAFYECILEVLSMPKENFNRIVMDSYHTVKYAFSKQKWDNEWMKFIKEIKN